jgi:hypothetical protein
MGTDRRRASAVATAGSRLLVSAEVATTTSPRLRRPTTPASAPGPRGSAQLQAQWWRVPGAALSASPCSSTVAPLRLRVLGRRQESPTGPFLTRSWWTPEIGVRGRVVEAHVRQGRITGRVSGSAARSVARGRRATRRRRALAFGAQTTARFQQPRGVDVITRHQRRAARVVELLASASCSPRCPLSGLHSVDSPHRSS